MKSSKSFRSSCNPRVTIGLLCGILNNEYATSVWHGVRDAAWEHGVNLIYFSGDMLSRPGYDDIPANIIYGLVNPERLDGLVIWGAQLAHIAGPEGVRALCQQYHPLPIINLGLVLEGIHSLLVDNYQGMRDVVTHLIEVHGYQRIVFLQGPEINIEALDRYHGYTDALISHGIPLDPSLVITEHEAERYSAQQGWDRLHTNRFAEIRVLLDDRKLRPKVDFDAVVGHDDSRSLGAVDELQSRGFRVPYDVAVASFDDIRESRCITPPFTEARQSFYDLGWQGVKRLLDLLAGEEVPEQTLLPMQIIVRQSCGCVDPVVLQTAANMVASTPECFEAVLTNHKEDILTAIKYDSDDGVEHMDSMWAERLLEGFFTEIRGESSGIVLTMLDNMLRPVVATGRDVSSWQGMVSTLRRQILPYLDYKTLARAENLWQQMRVIIGSIAERLKAYRAFQTEQQTHILREIGAKLISTFDIEKLMTALVAGLPRIGIPSMYLALYEDPQPYKYLQPVPKWSRLFLAYDEQGHRTLEPERPRFLSHDLVPGGLLSQDKQYSLVVEALYFQKQQLGFALFEAGPREGHVYETLRYQISSALQGALILQAHQRAENELTRHRDRLEELVQERTVELATINAQLLHLKKAVETMQLGVTITDLDGKILYTNPAEARIHGYEVEELLGKDVRIFAPTPPQEPITLERLKQWTGLIRESLNIRKDGSIFPVQLMSEVVRDAKGEPIAIVTSCEDITERKRAEEELNRHQDHLEELVKDRTTELLVTNRELGETLTHLKHMQAQLVESEKMVALGQLVAGVAHEINTPLGAIRASIGNLSNALLESLQDLPHLFQALTSAQQNMFFALVNRAIQSQKPLTSKEERTLRRALRSELESYAIADADLLADLFVDIGIYEHLMPFMPLFQVPNPKIIAHTAYNLVMQQHNSANILTAVERMTKIIFALKTYTHYDPTGQKIEAKITDGIEVVLTLYHNQLKHGITVLKHYDDLPPIQCYPDELNQVWTNLIHNAIWTMNGQGILEISVHGGEGQGEVVVQITDSGCGIPEEIKDRIFEPFFTTKPAGEGSGLGLGICKKIIEKHQGKITFESQPGRTTFSVFLPRMTA